MYVNCIQVATGVLMSVRKSFLTSLLEIIYVGYNIYYMLYPTSATRKSEALLHISADFRHIFFGSKCRI
jgi:hypothetical protein